MQKHWFICRAVPVALALGCLACASTQSDGRPPETTQVPPAGPVSVNESEPGTIPVGQEIDVRLRGNLSSETATVEQRFETTTVVDLMQDGRVLVPAGTVIRGVVSDVDKAGRLDRDGSLTLTFDRIEVGNQEREIRGSATQVFESDAIRGELPRAGVGAGVGGVVGGLIGGLQGAIVGAAIGAGGTIAATDGTDVTLPAGSIIRVRMDSPVRLG